ncbi:MAG: hypothetical protein WCC21_03035 [Candidatus Acidiferrales bacterium]
MQIAILGWGSLIWCPGSLQIKSCWHRDGPDLPIEFARVSKDGRLTLVIHAGSEDQQTLWAAAVSDDVEVVRESLRAREETGARFIHSATVAGVFSDGVGKEVRDSIENWLKARPGLKGCVWTGLPSNWKETRHSDFSVTGAVEYLNNLLEPSRAREYIQNTPRQIQTTVRGAVRKKLQWLDAELSPALFTED